MIAINYKNIVFFLGDTAGNELKKNSSFLKQRFLSFEAKFQREINHKQKMVYRKSCRVPRLIACSRHHRAVKN